METELTIRMAKSSDARELLEIYGPYVENTAISFEYTVPSVDEFACRIEKTLQFYPYLVAEIDGRIVGYAYVSPFKEREAYAWAGETTIYIREGWKGKGCGKQLYLALEEILKKQKIQNLNACIAYTEQEDEHLTNASMEFHSHMGYQMVGTFHKCGYKFGRWYDMIWMEKMIGEHPETPEKVFPVSRIVDPGA